jgi:hypothetical protein
MDLQSRGRATALIVQLYGSSGILSQTTKRRVPVWMLQFLKLCGNVMTAPFLIVSVSRKLCHYAYYQLQCVLYTYRWVENITWLNGMICLDLKPKLEMATSTDRNGPRANCLSVFDQISRPTLLWDSTDPNAPMLTHLRIPRDIIFVYTDQDPNILRKVSLVNSMKG